MELISILDKMSSYSAHPIEYQLHTENDFIKMNELIGKKIKIKFLNQRFCSSCKLEYPSLYRMGFCKNCFFTKPEAGESIIRPELSRAHENVVDRDLAFEKSYQLQPHVVYLANSGGLKVGVTRANNTTTRWTDQGALEAILLAETSNRYEAGIIEVFLKDYVSDKTVWQKMLKNEYEPIDLVKEKYRLTDVLSQELKVFVSKNDDVHKLDYPVSQYPVKVKSINLEKVPEFEGEFKGMRGQYLIFEGGVVLNVRSHSGYRVQISF